MSEIVRNNPVIIYIGNKAYDVTFFINKHPGGASAIIHKSGKDVTRDYMWHSKKTREEWELYRSPSNDKPELHDKTECNIL
jgi:cytochrome b involved in lipid metabolism